MSNNHIASHNNKFKKILQISPAQKQINIFFNVWLVLLICVIFSFYNFEKI